MKTFSVLLIGLIAFTICTNGFNLITNNDYHAFASSNTILGDSNQTVLFPLFENNVLDSSIYHNSGVVTGASKYVTGKMGSYAFSFDGATHITYSNPSRFAFDLTNPFSMSFWIKMPPNSSQDMYLVSNSYDQNSAGISIWKSHLSNSLTFKIQNTWGKPFEISGTSNISDNNWHLVLITFDGSSNQKGMKLYVDGALQAVGIPSYMSGTIVSGKPLTIGSTASGSLHFTGVLDNVRILNFLRSSSVLQAFYSTPQPFPPTISLPTTTKTGVSVSWLPVIGAIGYNIYRDGVKVNSVLEVSPSYFDSGLQPSTTHTYRVVAVNSTGGTSPFSKSITVATSSTSLSKPLRAVIFSPNMTKSTMDVLKANFQAGDGIISTRIPYIESFQDTLGIPGQKHFLLAPHITPIDPTCELGPVPSFSQLVTQAQNAKTAGYYIDAIVYDIEGWCWTPQIERDNYVSYIDKAAQLAHSGGFKSAVVPTHSELLQWYKNIHWSNIDYLFIQFQKQQMTKESNYTLKDPTYVPDVTNIINTVRSQNPNISIFIHFSANWEPTDAMIDNLNHFKNQIQGVNVYDLPKNDPLNIGSPFPGYNTPNHHNQFLKAVKSM